MPNVTGLSSSQAHLTGVFLIVPIPLSTHSKGSQGLPTFDSNVSKTLEYKIGVTE